LHQLYGNAILQTTGPTSFDSFDRLYLWLEKLFILEQSSEIDCELIANTFDFDDGVVLDAHLFLAKNSKN